MGWEQHTSVRFDLRGDVILVVAAGDVPSITRQGHLRLPLAVRRRRRIDAGSSLVVVAWPRDGILALCSPSITGEMILARITQPVTCSQDRT